MKNQWLKGISVVIVATLAIGVNILGFAKTRKDSQEQQIEQAVVTINSQAKQLDSVKKSINAVYVDETQDLLQPNTTVEQIIKIENELNRLKVTASDFSLSASDLPAEVENLSQEKSQLQTQLQAVRDKVKLQEKLIKLFTNETINFNQVTNDIIIRKDATLAEIEELQEAVEKISGDSGDQWKTMMNEYLDYATAQVNRVNDLQASFEEMLNEGVVTESATYERYLSVTDSVAQVRNPELKEQFQSQLERISEQLGFGTTNYYEEQSYY